MRFPRAPSNKWLVVGVAGLGVMGSTMDTTSVAIALPHLADALGVGTSLVLWVSLLYILVVAGLLFTMGWLGDVAGRREVFAAGFVVFAAGLLLSAASPNIWFLLGARAVQAVGAAMTQANEFAVVAQAFPPGERPKAVGFQGVGVGLGLALGPLIGGVLLDYLDWRALFYVRAPHALIVAILAFWVIRNERPIVAQPRTRPDVLGAVLLFATMGSLLLAVNQFGRVGATSPVVWASAATLFVALPAFLVVEKRAARPVLDLSLFGVRAFRLAALSAIGFYVARSIVDYLTPFYLQRGLGYAAATAGLFMSTFHVMRMIGSPTAGTLGTWFTARTLSSAALVVLAGGVLALGTLGATPAVGTLLVALVLAGTGAGTFEAPNTAAILNIGPADRRGASSAAVATARQIGQSSGVAFGGALFASLTVSQRAALVAQGVPAADAARAATVSAYGNALWLALGSALLALVVSLVRSGGWVRAGESVVEHPS